ncbi:MAG: hypothetical protein NTY98_03895 [Verrucomicrobia bacterium]|nr:hypothetical protein [Verrucomicrobiota bacterium]
MNFSELNRSGLHNALHKRCLPFFDTLALLAYSSCLTLEMKFQILNREGDCVADGEAELLESLLWSGQISVHRFPAELMRLFDELNEALGGQSFVYAEGIDDKIAGHGLRVRLEDGRSMEAKRIFVNEVLGISWHDSSWKPYHAFHS